jgi:hypothetical protein
MKSAPQWYDFAPSRLAREREYLASLPYFALERTTAVPGFIATGIIHFLGHRSGRIRALRIRLEYPRFFPKKPPRVFDQDEIFPTGADGHLLSNYELCLTLPERGEFSVNTETLTTEVLGASLIWFHKRLLYERTGTWPGPAERHGINAFLDLLVDKGIVTHTGSMSTWLQQHATSPQGSIKAPDAYAPCPCGSGKRLKFCHHDDLAPLVERLARTPKDRQLKDVLGTK